MPKIAVLLLLSAATLSTGCAATLIPNTDVEDSAENRDVLGFVEGYRHAVEARDIPRLLALASPRYLDHNGTVTGADDVDLETLRAKITALHSAIEDVRFEIRYRRVTFRGERVFVDLTYTGSFRIGETGGGHHWSRRLSDQRIVLERKDESFLILSGM
jgi:SnoaL-like domain